MSGKSRRVKTLEAKAAEILGDKLDGRELEICRVPNAMNLFDCIRHWYGGVDCAELKNGVDAGDKDQGNHYCYEPVTYDRAKGFGIPATGGLENFEFFMRDVPELCRKTDAVLKENVSLIQKVSCLLRPSAWDESMLQGLSDMLEIPDIRKIIFAPEDVANRMEGYRAWNGDSYAFVYESPAWEHQHRAAEKLMDALRAKDAEKVALFAGGLSECLENLAADLAATSNGELRYIQDEKERIGQLHGGGSQPLACEFFVPEKPGRCRKVEFEDLKGEPYAIALSLDREGYGYLAPGLGDGIFSHDNVQSVFRMIADDVQCEASGDLYGWRLLKDGIELGNQCGYYGQDLEKNGMLRDLGEKLDELAKEAQKREAAPKP